MKDQLCSVMQRPCDETRGSGRCQMCYTTYLIKELRKIKDELKLLNSRLECNTDYDYGEMFSRKKRNNE